jgi:hypothetical protein
MQLYVNFQGNYKRIPKLLQSSGGSRDFSKGDGAVSTIKDGFQRGVPLSKYVIFTLFKMF